MTPEYASPEQVRGEAITTATDVYSLGLLLYEMLTGRRAQERASSLLEMERTICVTEVPAPSTSVDGTMRKRLRGDLDVIVATAAQKDPARRYATAELLAADVERHLRGLPIVARSDAFGYRATKFLRRHRVAVVAVSAVAVSLVVGFVLAVAGMVRAGRAERVAVAEAAASSRISDFLVDLFRHSDPGTARGEDFTARQLLDLGAAGIDSLASQPEVQARLLATMAEAYVGLGLFDPALGLFERELDVQRSTFGEESAEAARAMTRVASAYAKKGDFAHSRDVAMRALEIFATTVPEDGPDVSRALNQLAIAHGQLGENAEARAIFERSAEILERVHGSESLELTPPLTNLAIVFWQEGRLDEASALYEKVLRIQERERGAEHVSVAHTLNNLALVHAAAREFETSRATHERALAIRERLLEPEHPDIAESLNNLGSNLLALREYEQARGVFERALAIREAALGPEHVYTATTLANLGTAAYNLGDRVAARSHLTQAAARLERALGPDHPMIAYPFLVLAEIDSDEGRLDEADANFRRAIRIRVDRLGESRSETVEAREKYQAFLARAGRTASTVSGPAEGAGAPAGGSN
jgi:tetratricopeptide (TPR) repeat protein